MKKLGRNLKLLSISSGILLFSIILMIVVAMLILFDISPNTPPKEAGFAVLAAIAIHLLIFAGLLKAIRENRRSRSNRHGEYIGLCILLIIFGLIYMDGAIAYWGNSNTLVLSILMFISTLSDFVASFIVVRVFFLKSEGGNKNNFTHNKVKP